jgi:tetratricopeptide (TPR) repeat protein
MNHRSRPLALAALSAAALLALAGCNSAKHGEYTQEHLDQSKAKIDGLKSANEYEQAKQAFLAGELDKAMNKIDKSLSLNPNVPKSFVLRGRIQIERGDLDGALQSLAKAEQLEPANVEAQYYAGIILERFGKKDEALARYTKAAELDPSNAQYPIAASEMMIDQAQFEQAENYLLGLNSRFEHHSGVRQTLGHIAQLRGDNERALGYFNEAHLLAPDDTIILEDLIRAQMAVGKLGDAEVSLARLLTAPANSGRRDLRHMRVQCLVSLSRPVEAREILLSLTGDPAGANDEEAWVGLGNVAYALRDFSRVRAAAQRVSAIAPTRFEGPFFRALWHRQQGEPTQALDSIVKAVALRGTSTDPLVVQGLIFQDLSKPNEARKSFAQAAKEDPSNPTIIKLLNEASQAVRTATVTEQP